MQFGTENRWIAAAIGTVALLALASLPAADAQSMPMPFGGKGDVKFAGALWKTLEKEHFVGPRAIHSVTYPGKSPHGMIVETTEGRVAVKGHGGRVLVKFNYGGPDLTPSKAIGDRGQYLKAVTVMFQRESGYDEDNQNWYWAKYMPNGQLAKNEKGMMLAGRVAKGMKMGCIACHKAGAGGDYLFFNDAARLDK